MRWVLQCTVACGLACASAAAQPASVAPSRPLGAEAFGAVRTFFAYDISVPLNARIVDSVKTTAYRREKIVFTGADGNRVPAYLAMPPRTANKMPVVIAMHAGASSKDDWWREDGFERGGLVTNRLLNAGIAVLALDARFHGERSGASDFDSFRAMWFDRKWFNWIRDGMLLTVKDYRRAVDYLWTRADIDTSRVGVVGYSLGGIMALQLTAFESRIRVAVACVAGLDEPWLYPIAPINISPGLGRVPLLLLGGRSDPLVSEQNMTALRNAIAGTQHRLVLFDAGHRLPATYADSASAWLVARLR